MTSLHGGADRRDERTWRESAPWGRRLRFASFVSCGVAALCGSPAVFAADPPSPEPWSLFGGFTYHGFSAPGGHLGVEYALAGSGSFRSLASLSAQVHHRSDSDTGVALHLRWGQRFTSSFGLTVDSFAGVGAQYTRYTTFVFEFEDAIAKTVQGSESRVAFSPHVALGLGYDFEPLLQVPCHLYVRPGLALVYPELNQAFHVTPIAELGLRWTPDW